MTTVLYRADLDTPVGPFLLLTDADGAVRASGFTADLAEVLALLPRAGTGAEVRPAADAPDDDPTAPALDALRRFFAGDLTALDGVPVRQDADPERPVARMRVRLRAVGPGETRTYAGLAADAGLPRAPRAAGQACSRNAVAPFVPCHRVLSTSGGLGGYRWGLPVKRALLDHERAHAAGADGPRPLPLEVPVAG
ncbi:methylated-DNA--[protein]-cysteine S-methyltransferase [Patulibacter sp. SYSU D01012]|uniref:methylated-DNA--[protein]-cysteine S-methyltransferase n=1 Tax=Patulibacter sp. SYSU D01012 TaxID=2817381 RepID=UPI001B31677C|nr:methylated-DNA--[protein]-cysteine S-methyltransferase [Patulibacter sp. SYSU D01012]